MKINITMKKDRLGRIYPLTENEEYSIAVDLIEELLRTKEQKDEMLYHILENKYNNSKYIDGLNNYSYEISEQKVKVFNGLSEIEKEYDINKFYILLKKIYELEIQIMEEEKFVEKEYTIEI